MIDVTGLDVPDEEIFGPVLQVIRVPDFEAALAAANATRFGLSASLIGGDEALYRRFWAAKPRGRWSTGTGRPMARPPRRRLAGWAFRGTTARAPTMRRTIARGRWRAWKARRSPRRR